MQHILLSSITIIFSLLPLIPASAENPSDHNMMLIRKVLVENGQQNLPQEKLIQFANALADVDTFSETSNFNHLTEENKQDLVACSALLHSSEGTVLVDDLKACYGLRTVVD